MIRLRTLGSIGLNDAEGHELRPVLAQTKRLALLVMLAAGRGGRSRRDTLVGLFWPDQDTDHARGALRQAVRFLRRELGEEVIVGIGDDELEIPSAELACDATQFEQAIAEKRFEDAFELYRGEFLPGLFVPDAAPEFDDWLDAERSRLRQQALDAASRLITSSRDRGGAASALPWARRAASLAPDDERLQQELITLLHESGDRVSALRAYDEFAACLARQLGVKPSAAMRELVAGYREETTRANAIPSAATRLLPDPRKGVAVLTFVNMTGDPDQDFLCHGFTEELRSVLAHVEGIRTAPVTGNFAFKDRQPNLALLRERLDIDAVLDGTIWRGGSNARVSAQLIDVIDGHQLWAESYAREWQHLPGLQGQLARAIVAGVQLKLTGRSAPLVERPTADVEAYNLYLKGRFCWAGRTVAPLRALEYLNQAIELDPEFALAHAGVADAYNTAGSWETSMLPPWEALPKAQAAAMRALEINPQLAEAHAALAYANAHFLWDCEGAERQLCRALALNPDYQHAHHWYSHLTMALGRVDESLHWSMRALQSDPLDAIISIHLAWHYWFARQYEQMLEQCDRTVELDTTGVATPVLAGFGYIEIENATAAIETHRTAVERSAGTNPAAIAALGYSYAAGGERKLAKGVLKRLREIGAHRGMYGYEMAVIHGALGEIDIAFNELHRAYREHSSWLLYLNADPRLDRLRSDTRFTTLLQKIGLHRVPSATR